MFQLSMEAVESLFKVYKALFKVNKKDFLMFGYSPQQYKDIALKEEENRYFEISLVDVVLGFAIINSIHKKCFVFLF